MNTAVRFALVVFSGLQYTNPTNFGVKMLLASMRRTSSLSRFSYDCWKQVRIPLFFV
ncbi:hypothetical protein OESDEN_17421 [Oesophagostomum dentatum]|uniref:Uncharacterized protein n=1 Tax=Oesophagostomum dentatum TaxID=61180 RepID=A0A0B1SD67_OESDE|nr:hypothetical protein OESDEN_17421 [Oesophagostomum dentatum]